MPSVILQELPHEYIPPSMLKKVVMHGDTNKLYATEIRRSDQFERRVGGGFDRDEFEEFPDRYISTFSHKYAPYASVIVNGIYWSRTTPRLVTIPDAKALLQAGIIISLLSALSSILFIFYFIYSHSLHHGSLHR